MSRFPTKNVAIVTSTEVYPQNLDRVWKAPKSWRRPSHVTVIHHGSRHLEIKARFVSIWGDICKETLRLRQDGPGQWTRLSHSTSTHFSVKATRK